LAKPNAADAEKPKAPPHYPGVRKPAHDPVGSNANT
jgi:hypothetical protein